MAKQQAIWPLLEALTQMAIISQHINVVINGRPLGFIAKDQELTMRNMMAEVDKIFVTGVCELSNFIVKDAIEVEVVPQKASAKKKKKSTK